MPGHEVLLATIRDFTDASGAVRVTVVLEPGILVEAEPGEPLVVNDEHVVLPAELAGAAALPVSIPRPLPATAITADPQTGEISAPLGALEGLARGVEDLARALGGRTAAIAEFATSGGEPLSIAARPGETIVLAIGEQQFEFPG